MDSNHNEHRDAAFRQTVINSVTCGRCQSPPGVRCTNDAGAEQYYIHAMRFARFRRMQRLDRKDKPSPT